MRPDNPVEADEYELPESLYERMTGQIPLFEKPCSEGSDVIEYETNSQRNARYMRETRIEQLHESVRRLEAELQDMRSGMEDFASGLFTCCASMECANERIGQDVTGIEVMGHG